MKKFISIILAVSMALCCFVLVGCGKDDTKTGTKVAMITDYGDITDESFNQTTWEAVVAFCDENKIEKKYFKPTGDNTESRVAMIEKAISEGFDVIVMPGYAFAGAIVETAPKNKDVKFFALDVAKGDLLEAGVTAKGEKYDYNPDNWDLSKYVDMSNVYCAIYQEELCGYMAGYAAVKLGYTKLGFLGGMAVPAVVRYGYGFVQGADAAAKELNTTVAINYVYGGKFSGDADITAKMETWYQGGTEIVFACGGGIYTSAVDAAAQYDGKVIGVDVDQFPKIGDACITSAMKGLGSAVETALDAYTSGNWASIGGKSEQLGLTQGDYLGLPTDDASWGFKTFTKDEYETVLNGIKDGSITVSNDTENQPEVGSHVTVTYVE